MKNSKWNNNKWSKGTFDCPCCGNPLIFSNRDIIRCKYCSTPIVPTGYGDLRHRASIVVERKERGKANGENAKN